jgi:FlaA1/EpsC-like NDP-sugar epimerase
MKNLSGTIILITGGTSSFGNRVARHPLEQKPAQIRIYNRDEKKRWEMQRSFPQFRCIVGDVRVLGRLAEATRLPPAVAGVGATRRPKRTEARMETIRPEMISALR